jgi:hypothetical protein
MTHLAGHLIRPRPGAGVIDWAVAATSLSGPGEPGCQAVVRSSLHGVLVAVVDGLGRRTDAAVAASRAASTLEELADAPLRLVVRRCHEELAATNGAAIAIARFDARWHALEWLSVGNVEGVLARTEAQEWEHLGLRGGVVGYRLGPTRPRTLPVGPADTLVLATEGLPLPFAAQLDPLADPQQLADDVLARQSRDSVESLVLVARYLGIRP